MKSTLRSKDAGGCAGGVVVTCFLDVKRAFKSVLLWFLSCTVMTSFMSCFVSRRESCLPAQETGDHKNRLQIKQTLLCESKTSFVSYHH